jgi:hypothetical protein
MNLPPLLLRMELSRPDVKGYNVFWLPVFLAWIILAAIFLALMPLILFIALVALFFGFGKSVLLFIPLVCNVICNLHGMEINVKKKDRTIVLSFR